MERWMGVDFGDKRIGLALADEETKIATPWQNYTRRMPEIDGEYFRNIVRPKASPKSSSDCQSLPMARKLKSLATHVSSLVGSKACLAWKSSSGTNAIRPSKPTHSLRMRSCLRRKESTPGHAGRPDHAARLHRRRLSRDAQPSPLDNVIAQGGRF